MPSLPSKSRLRSTVKLSAAILAIFIIIVFLGGPSTWLASVSSKSSSLLSENFPKKIWQTWHTPAALLADEDKARVRSWLEKNPEYRHELITDKATEDFVRLHFFQEPLLRDTFLGLNDTILKADFLRYLVILAEGGVYADIDVECYQSIDTWLDQELWDKAGVIVGIEADRKPVPNDVKLYSDHREHIWSINNWTFMARRGHPFMRLVAESVAMNLLAIAKEQHCALSEIKLSYKQVIESTGPRAFSSAFLRYASKKIGTEITSADATMLEEPKMFGDVFILPIRAMSKSEADRGGDGAKSESWPAVLFHHSVGSWKGSHFATPEP